MAEVDYRALLKRYMAHVLTQEGVTFVSRIGEEHGFSASEAAVLLEIDAEVYAEDEG